MRFEDRFLFLLRFMSIPGCQPGLQRIPNKETPIRRWDNTIPELDIIMPFGCQVLIYARKRTGRRDPERRNFSLSLSGDQGLFLGHHGTTLFRVWNQNRKCYQVIYNMKPYLNSFPGLSSKKWEQTPAVNSTDESEESAEEEAIPVETEEEMLFHESQETEVVENRGLHRL